MFSCSHLLMIVTFLILVIACSISLVYRHVLVDVEKHLRNDRVVRTFGAMKVVFTRLLPENVFTKRGSNALLLLIGCPGNLTLVRRGTRLITRCPVSPTLIPPIIGSTSMTLILLKRLMDLTLEFLYRPTLLPTTLTTCY